MKIKKELVIEIVCMLFVMLFLYASVTKLLDYQKFRVQLGQSPMLTSFAGTVAWFIPAIEILTSILLLASRTRLVALYGAFGLMVMFTFYIIAITQFSEYIPCSCGGVLQNMGWTEHLIFNIAFVVLAAIAIVLKENKDSESPELHHEKLQPSQIG